MTSLSHFFSRPRLVGLLGGLTLSVTQLFTPAGLGIAQAATTTCTPNGASQSCTVTFSVSGAPETWTVPAGVTSATFDLYGAQGGAAGGLGGRVTATLAVAPGTSYQVLVGAWGYSTAPYPGYNGGGAGYADGGDASDVRSGAFGLADRLLVAGGGGGAGGGLDVSASGGGAGGYPSGGTGGAGGGGGGTQTAGGAGGVSTVNGSAGTLGQGGSGGAWDGPGSTFGTGGGGGGGYYGGGGGGGGSTTGGGGGGSSYATPAATNVSFQTGVRSQNGLVIISYSQSLPDTTAPVANPTQSPAANSNGWNNTDVTVTWNWSDPSTGSGYVSGINPATCPTSNQFGDEDIVNLIATCQDLAGNQGFGELIVRVDKTAPIVTITGVSSGATYLLGSVPTADCITTDGSSATASGVATPATLSLSGGNGDGTGIFEVVCSGALDNAGNSAGVGFSYTVIRPDTTAPVITPSVVGTLGNNDWYVSNVTVSWSVVDNESAISTQSGCDAQSVTSDTSGITFTCSASSTGGSNSQSVTIKIDKSAPVVAVTGVSNGAGYPLGSVPAAGCSTSDAGSGVATQATLNITGGNPDGTGSFTATCSGATDNAGNNVSASVTYNVSYNWSGFLQPVDNLPTVNTVNAGQGIPVKFSLGGNFGLNIFASGYPKVQTVACPNSSGGSGSDAIETTLTAGSSSLQYDPTSQTYTYVWKTDKSWASTCRQLIVKLIDGSEHIALFQFNGKARSASESQGEEVAAQQSFLPLVSR